MSEAVGVRRPIVIVGAGQHGRETLDIIEAIDAVAATYAFLGFLDDGEVDRALLDRRGAKVIGGMPELGGLQALYVLGVGSPTTRRPLDHLATAAGASPATLIHPSCTIGGDVELGPGTLLAAGARITTNVRTGRHVHLNVASTVAHDCRLGDYVSLSPGVHLSGNVDVGPEALLGTGAVVRPGCRIGAGAIVGAGAVVVSDVAPGSTVAGVPARALPPGSTIHDGS